MRNLDPSRLKYSDPRIAWLPKSIRPVAEHLGYGIVVRIIEAVPGVRLVVPKVFRDNAVGDEEKNVSFMLLSADDRKSLIKEFGGDVIYVPASLKTTEWREAKIKEMFLAGADCNLIAIEVGLVRNSVMIAIRRLGLKRDYTAPLKERRRRMVEAARQGKSPADIATEFGVTVRQIKSALREEGILPPPKKRNAVSSISDGYLTRHAEGDSNTPSRNTKKPARAPENAI